MHESTGIKKGGINCGNKEGERGLEKEEME
jgi:hypothetical protein